MKIGARNRLEGKVTDIKRGTVMCQVKVQVAGNAVMESVMTLDRYSDRGREAPMGGAWHPALQCDS